MQALYAENAKQSSRGSETRALDMKFGYSKHRGMDIRSFRKAKGLRLADLAKEVGVTKGYLSTIETGGSCSAAVALKLEAFSEGVVDAAALSPTVAAARRPTQAA